MIRPTRAGIVAALLLLTGSGAAPAGPPQGVTISDGYFVTAADHAAHGFFTVANTSDTAVLITGWQSPACSKLSFSEAGATPPAEDPSPLDKLTVPARQKMVFARGGYHLQCAGPAAAVQPGGTIPVTVSFLGGNTITASFQVRQASTGK